MPTSRDKSLDELEGFQPRPSFGTELGHHVWRARQVPISRLTPADLRLLVSQRQGSLYVLPRTLELLEEDPWLQADNYRGDLLAALVRLEDVHWPPEREWRQRAAAVIRRALDLAPSLEEHDRNESLEAELRAAAERHG